MDELTEKIIIDAQDKSAAAFNSVEKKIGNMTKKIKDMQPVFKGMAATGGIALAGITAAVATSISAYGEAERAQRQLEHAVIAVSKGTQDQVKAINDAATALQKKSGIDGDALAMGAAQLSTFGLQSKSVVDLTKSLADLTVNQNGVNASSDQYVQSANMMAKALNGQFGILEKSGIRFTDAQQKIIKFGTESEKVAALQEGLAQNLRETTDTLNGVDASTAKLNRQFGEIQENIGKALAPALNDLTAKLVPMIDKIGDWTSENPALTAQIIEISAAVAALVTGIGTLGMLLGSLSSAAAALGISLGALFPLIALLVGGITAVVMITKELWSRWEEFKLSCITLWNEIVYRITVAIDNVIYKVAEMAGANAAQLKRMRDDMNADILQKYDAVQSGYSAINALHKTKLEEQKKIIEDQIAQQKDIVIATTGDMQRQAKEKLEQLKNDGLKQFKDLKLGSTAELAQMRAAETAELNKAAAAAAKIFAGQVFAASKWGADMMQNLMNGIWGRIPALNKVMASVKYVLQSIHQSYNPELPAEKWGQDFMENYAQGVWIGSKKVNVQIAKIKTALQSIKDIAATVIGNPGATQSAGNGDWINPATAVDNSGWVNNDETRNQQATKRQAVKWNSPHILTAEESAAQRGQSIIFNFNDAVAGDDGVMKIIKKAVAQINRSNTLKTAAGI
jgi:hypothetical protein